jgi:uncharacterized membrane protein (DUF106 family)
MLLYPRLIFYLFTDVIRCDEYKTQMQASDDIEKKKQLETNHQLHLSKVEKARKSLQEDTTLAKKGEVYVLTMDLQKALPFPKLSLSIAY